MASTPREHARRREPRQGRSRALVDAIVEASLQLFARDATEDVSVRTIAERAGVSVGSLYQYFKSREGVLDAVVERLTDENFAAFREVLEEHRDAPLDELFDAIIDRVIETYVERPVLTRVATRTVMAFGRIGAITAERDRFVRLFADHVLAARPDLDREELTASAILVTDMVMGAVVSQVYRPFDGQWVERVRESARRLARAELQRLLPT